MSNVILDGWNKFQIHDLEIDDITGLLKMIKGAKLPERRQFNHLKEQLEYILRLWRVTNPTTHETI